MRRVVEPFVFALAAVAGWTLTSSLFGEPSSTAASDGAGVVHASASMSGADALEAGRSELRRGRHEAAERYLRHAWRVPESRGAAARLLRNLHDRPGSSLSVDEEAVDATLEALGPGFVRHETDHFVILSDVGRNWTVGRGRLLERTYNQFFRVADRMEFPARPPESKMLCVLFRDHGMYAAFARTHDGVEAPWIAGYYAGRSNRIVFYDDRSGPAFQEAFRNLSELEEEISRARSEARSAQRQGQSQRAASLTAHADDLERRIALERRRLGDEADRSSEAKTIHEAIHLLAFNCGLQSRARSYPFWVTEGLAAAFETDRPHAAFGPDHPTSAREEEFREHASAGDLFDLEVFVALSAAPQMEDRSVDVMYSQSYALLAHLYRYERRALSEYLLDFWSEPPGRIDPARQQAMFEERFGRTQAVERRLVGRSGGRRSGSSLARP